MGETRISFISPIGTVVVRAGSRGIVGIDLCDDEPTDATGEGSEYAEQAARELREYFAGERRSFDVQLDMKGSDFSLAVWGALREIPFGQTVSYGDIARKIGRPSASRAVGAANGRNPIPIIVPCHRVIGADGALTGYACGLWRKRWLLEHEGII